MFVLIVYPSAKYRMGDGYLLECQLYLVYEGESAEVFNYDVHGWEVLFIISTINTKCNLFISFVLDSVGHLLFLNLVIIPC